MCIYIHICIYIYIYIYRASDRGLMGGLWLGARTHSRGFIISYDIIV